MKTLLKYLIAGVVGLLVSWVCLTLFKLDQQLAVLPAVFMALAAYAVCDKLIKTK